MDDFIKEYRLELDESRIVENKSILYPNAIAYYVVLLSRKRQTEVSFMLYLNSKYGDLTKQDDALATYLNEIGITLIDGSFPTLELWRKEGGYDIYSKNNAGQSWLEERYTYARKVYEDFGALVGEEGREDLLKA